MIANNTIPRARADAANVSNRVIMKYLNNVAVFKGCHLLKFSNVD